MPIIVGDASIRVRIARHTGPLIVYRDGVSGRADLSGIQQTPDRRVIAIITILKLSISYDIFSVDGGAEKMPGPARASAVRNGPG